MSLSLRRCQPLATRTSFFVRLWLLQETNANNDMAGSDDDSWLSQFKASGKFDKIDTQINGLGEIEGIQKLYVEHTAAAMSK